MRISDNSSPLSFFVRVTLLSYAALNYLPFLTDLHFDLRLKSIISDFSSKITITADLQLDLMTQSCPNSSDFGEDDGAFTVGKL